jgi:effector-binding domain-containing protein
MPGGLIQLVAYGAQNVFLNGNPTVSFFKKVYKTHTNFSTESIKVIFNKTYIDFNDTTLFIAKIDRNADLIQEIYFSFEIPEIKKKLREDFRFVKNLGEVMIDYYKIYIGGTLVDTQYGEWLHIWNELTIESSKKYGYDKLIGNIPEIYSPDPHNFRQNEEVQVEKRRLYVPLKFYHLSRYNTTK